MPGAVFAVVANVVGPGGRVGHEVASGVAAIAFELRIDGIFGEQLFNELAGLRCELLLGNQGDGLVALAAPGVGWRTAAAKANRIRNSRTDGD
jgi:hypothetical protein